MKRVETSADLQAAVAGKKTTVLFHATWCGYCRRYRPVFEAETAKASFEVVEAVIDDEENPIWDEHAIELVPTVLFFEAGKVVKRLDGRPGVGLTRDELAAALRGT